MCPRLAGLNPGSSSKIDGVQTTNFGTSPHRAASATARVFADDARIAWTVG